MAIDFPPSPADKQTFTAGSKKWQYSSQFAQWIASNSNGEAQITASLTAPTAPTEGAIWFNSSNAITSIYYDSAWIDIGANPTSSIDTGVVAYYALSSAPAGWIECNGAAITTALGSSYTNLRTLLLGGSSPFGVSGVDPKIPDLRGKFIRSNGSDGTYTSAAFGAKQLDELKSHSHTFTIHGDTGGNGIYTESTLDSSIMYTATTALTGGTETRPVNVALLACIKL